MRRNPLSLFCGMAAALLLTLIGAACAPVATSVPGVTLAPTEAVPVTGDGPSVTVSDQEFEGNTVVIERVFSNGQGWIAIHIQQDGRLGDAIAFAPVQDGENTNVPVEIDLSKATPVMYAMLHTDAGELGKYEFPGPDVPVLVEGQMITPPFSASIPTGSGTEQPFVTVRDQEVKAGKVIIEEVFSEGPGWLDIHIQNADGTRGKDIGFAPIQPGLNKNVVVTIDPSRVTPVLYAVLHHDAGEVGVYELPPGPDTNVELNGEVLGPTFRIGTAAELAAAGEATGTPAGNTAGSTTATPTAQAAQPDASTPTTQAGQHEMVTPVGGVGPSVTVRDQEVVYGSVNVELVVSSQPGWVVIYTTLPNGQPDQAIGYTAVKEGENRDVVVQVDPEKASGTLYAQIHIDEGTAGTFEFPGADNPLMVGVQMVATTFEVQQGQAANSAVPSIKVLDQPLQDGTVTIQEVFSVGETWLVIHKQNPDGKMGTFIGSTRVKDGLNNNVVVRVNTNLVTPILYAMLHEDKGTIGQLEFPGADVPVMVNGEALTPPFAVITTGSQDVVINVSTDTTVVKHLVDKGGRSLYLSLNDVPGQSNCTADCLTVWKPVLATGRIVPGAGVTQNKLGVIVLPDGTRQVTYSGAPLYTYSQDVNPGDANGQGVDGLWFLVNP